MKSTTSTRRLVAVVGALAASATLLTAGLGTAQAAPQVPGSAGGNGEGAIAAVPGATHQPGVPTVTIEFRDRGGQLIRLQIDTPPVTRTQILQRAQHWADIPVGYSQSLDQSTWFEGYRRDCSGYVSATWGIGASLTTLSLPQVAHPISKDQLLPGDVLLAPDNHVVIFEGWTSSAHTAYKGYEQTEPHTLHWQAIPYPYFNHQSEYSPWRYDNVVADESPAVEDDEARGGIAATTNSVEHTANVYALKTDGNIWHRWFVSGVGWSQEDLGGNFTGVPTAVANNAAGTTNLFARKTDGFIYHRSFVPSQGWSGWSQLPAVEDVVFLGDPIVIDNDAARSLNIFARGDDGNLWHRSFLSGQGWSSWGSLGQVGGGLRGDPGVTDNDAERTANVFMRGANGHLFQKSFVSGQGWSGWGDLGLPPSGTTFVGDPIVVDNDADRSATVFIRALDGNLYFKSFTSGQGWSAWNSLASMGGGFAGNPAVTDNDAEHAVSVYMRSINGLLYHRSYVSGQGWSGWASLGSGFDRSPTAIDNDAERSAHVYIRAVGGILYEKSFVSGQGWSGWSSHGGGFA